MSNVSTGFLNALYGRLCAEVGSIDAQTAKLEARKKSLLDQIAALDAIVGELKTREGEARAEAQPTEAAKK